MSDSEGATAWIFPSGSEKLKKRVTESGVYKAFRAVKVVFFGDPVKEQLNKVRDPLSDKKVSELVGSLSGVSFPNGHFV